MTKITKALEELGYEVDHAMDMGRDFDYFRVGHIDALLSELKELRAALKPFASACEGGDDLKIGDHVDAWESPLATEVTHGDFRRAFATLHGKKP